MRVPLALGYTPRATRLSFFAYDYFLGGLLLLLCFALTAPGFVKHVQNRALLSNTFAKGVKYAELLRLCCPAEPAPGGAGGAWHAGMGGREAVGGSNEAERRRGRTAARAELPLVSQPKNSLREDLPYCSSKEMVGSHTVSKRANYRE